MTEAHSKGKPGIYTSVILIIILFSFIFFLSFAMAFFRLSNNTMENTIKQCGMRVSIIIRQTLHNSMAHTNPSELVEMMNDIKALPDIDNINLYNHNGYIIHTTDFGAHNDKYLISEAPCSYCHIQGASPSKEETFHYDVIKNNTGHRQLIVTNSILNQKTCSEAACHFHEPTRSMLGLIEVKIPLDEMDQVVQYSEIRFSIIAIIITLGLILSVVVFTNRRIKRPLNTLVQASRQVASGDLKVRIETHDNDLSDMHEVSNAFNNMLDQLETANKELQTWSRDLERKIQDRTERLKSAQNELIHVERMASLGKLSASVAHEINNPLAGVLTYTKLVSRQLKDRECDPDKKENMVKYLELIESETKRCGNIVKGLLDFSRNDTTVFQPKHINQILKETAALMAHPMKVGSVDFETDFTAQSDLVMCNPNQIKQLCIAILVNAQEALKESGTVIFRTDNPEKDVLRIQIIDNGVGIAEEDMEYIFEPFFSRKLETSGVGLGLAVAHGLVQQHKGRILVDSKQGSGTTFNIEFPLAEREDSND